MDELIAKFDSQYQTKLQQLFKDIAQAELEEAKDLKVIEEAEDDPKLEVLQAEMDKKAKERKALLVETFKEICAPFWQEVIIKLPISGWHSNDSFEPWIKLEAYLRKEKGFPQDIHHSFFYAALTEKFNQDLAEGSLSAEQLIALFIECTRTILNKAKGEANYPYARLREKFNQPQESDKLTKFTSLFCALFWVLHVHCNPQQKKLVQYLIYYRANTTNNERVSEAAIACSILNIDKNCKNFFREATILNRYLGIINDKTLDKVQSLLPRISTRYIFKLMHSFYKKDLGNFVGLIKPRAKSEETIPATLLTFRHVAFSNLYFYQTILTFYDLGCYIANRKKEPDNDSAVWGKDIKILVAENEQKELKGEKTKWSLCGFFAGKQGRLGDILARKEPGSLILNP